MASTSSLTGSTVLVTGGARGLGRAIALTAAVRRARVVLWDRDLERATEVRDLVLAAGGRAWAHEVDVTDQSSVDAAAARTVDEVGGVDVLVNNAGVVSGKPLLELSEAEIDRTFAVNTRALYRTTRAFLPGMIERGTGTVVTVSSAASLVGVARQTDYAASKWAATGFTESLRAELRASGTGVRTLTVTPYYIDTGMFDGVRTRFSALLPILDERVVATKIIRAVETGRTGLALPPLVRVVPLVRALPPAWRDAVLDALGINVGMDEFVGRR